MQYYSLIVRTALTKARERFYARDSYLAVSEKNRIKPR